MGSHFDRALSPDFVKKMRAAAVDGLTCRINQCYRSGRECGRARLQVAQFGPALNVVVDGRRGLLTLGRNPFLFRQSGWKSDNWRQ
jgi:hypothetical protein